MIQIEKVLTNIKYLFFKSVGIKKIILLFGTFLFLMQCADNVRHEYQIEVIYTSIPQLIDGNLDDPWQLARPVMLKENHSGNNVNDPRLTTHAMTCYDDSTLYIAFVCNDPDIWTSFTQRHEYFWEEEAVDVFIDLDDVSESYVEIEVSLANVLFESFIVDPENIDVPTTARLDLPGIRTAVRVNGTLNMSDDKDDS